ncbi:unnamed protein product [Withania somnifera]
MKRGIGEEKVMGPIFPRLHVNNTVKGGPRASPRNKMALYEQLSIPSQRYNPSDLPLNDCNSANLVPPHSSQENEHETGVFFSRQPPALGHSVEKPRSCSSGSNTPLPKVKSKEQIGKEDFRIPTFAFSGCSNSELKELRGLITGQHGKSQIRNNSKGSKGASDSLSMDKQDSTLKRTDELLHFKPRGYLVNTFGELHKTNIVFDSQVDCTVFSGSVIDVDNDSEEVKTCKSSQTGEMEQSSGLSETSMIEFYLKWTYLLMIQQRVLAVQIFELHRLLEVQKLIAGSPKVNLEDAAYLGKSLKRLSAKRISLEHSVKAPENVSLSKNDSEKPKARMECNAKTDVGKTSLSSVQNGSQLSSCRPLSEKTPPTSVRYDSFVSPWCFNQPPGYQWLIPIMSPSERLVYKPHPGPAVISPVYGGFGSPGLTSSTGKFLAPAYGLTFAPPTGHGYFHPFGMPVMNPAIPFPAQYQSNQVAATRKLSNVVRLYPSRDSELQASTASSPSERSRGVDVAIDNPVVWPQPQFPNRPDRVIKVVPHNARSATESAARIFQSIQEERKQY